MRRTRKGKMKKGKGKTKKMRNMKRRVRKTRGGFFTGASYLLNQGLSIFQVPPPVPYGNPTLLVQS